MSNKASFWGFRRENGRVGVRNYVAILPVDDISNAACEAVANNVKGTLAIPHAYGRLQFGEDLELHFRTMIGTGANPNCAAVVVIGIEPGWTRRIADGIRETGKPVAEFSIEQNGDFETIRRSGKNVTIILTRNDTFGWIRGEAILLDDVDEPWSTDFSAVDYVKVAEGFGFQTARITAESEIEDILRAAIENPGANFIEVMVPSQDKIVPFVPNWVEAAKEKGLPYFT